MDLYRRSIQIIRQCQTTSGAYLASRTFPQYRFSWLRDGSFIAHAMDRTGNRDSAEAFHRWVSRTIRKYEWKVDRAISQIKENRPLSQDDYLHTRFASQGEEVDGNWWDFQLDGYGAWLWSCGEHIKNKQTEGLTQVLSSSISTTVRYLLHVWHLPNYDCWEEHAQYVHPYTLGAIYAGLKSVQTLQPNLAQEIEITTVKIKNFLLEHGLIAGRFVKSFSLNDHPQSVLSDTQSIFHDPGTGEPYIDAADASLIGLITPFQFLAEDDQRIVNTTSRIETELHRPGGGVYRYCSDSYYGGGEWILLAAWLGWHYARTGKIAAARELKTWVEAQANENGLLPEQVSDHMLAPDRLSEWESRWGPSARQLTWSHAMYLLLCQEMNDNDQL